MNENKLTLKEKIILIVTGLLICSITFYISFSLIKNKKKPRKRKKISTYTAVHVKSFFPTDENIILKTMGTVIPEIEVDLQSEVSGKIVSVDSDFIEGSIIKKNQLLAKIDSFDYEQTVISKKAALADALYNLKLEQGKQDIAKREWSMYTPKKNLTKLEKELMLRKPQLQEKQAKYEAALSELNKAKRDLKKTIINSPITAIVKTKNINYGEQITNQKILASLIGINKFWVKTTVRIENLKWINFPKTLNDTGSSVEVIRTTGKVIKGKVIKLLSELETNGRMAQILIEVPDPYNLKNKNSKTPLLLGEYVKISIHGKKMKNIYNIPRKYLHENSKFWFAKNDKLKIIEKKILWKDTEKIFVEDFNTNDKLIISDIVGPVENMDLQIIKN